MDNSKVELLDVKITSPKEEIFQGKAISVSSKNSNGNFDILPEHANFITIVEKEPIVIVKDNKEKLTFNFSEAIISHSLNHVQIFAEPQSI